MKSALWIPLACLIAFGVYTAGVVAAEGYTGFLSLALAEPWAGQLFVDLVIALTLFLVWMVPDARAHQIPAWPYVLLVLTVGSIGALAYLVHRAAKPTPASAAVAAAPRSAA